MSPRIITSAPAFKPHTSQWQRDRAAGVILPIDEHGRAWTPMRLAMNFACCWTVFVPFIVWSILA